MELSPDLEIKYASQLKYESPFGSRYAGREMLRNFSELRKFSNWRLLWCYLAEAERELGLNITDEQLAEMRANVYNIDFEVAQRQEKLVRHDVMAHVHTFAVCCPSAAPIIHLGATSAYVTDNADLMAMRDGFGILLVKLVNTIDALRKFCLEYKEMPCLAYTHLQPGEINLETFNRLVTFIVMLLILSSPTNNSGEKVRIQSTDYIEIDIGI